MASIRCRRRSAVFLVALLVVACLGLFAALFGGRGDVVGTDGGSGDAMSAAGEVGATGATADTAAADGTDASESADETTGSGSSDASSTSEGAAGSLTERRVWNVDTDVAQTAKDVLEGYEVRGDTSLARAGWLDLLGGVWGCAVVGPGWVDVCFVERQEDEGSRVTSLRMEVERWREAYGNEGEGDG